ncbi:MAG TPA: hypothetical protein VF871_03235 [Burkholderiales bacterium]
MYAKNRIPLYEGDGYFHPMQDRQPAPSKEVTPVSEPRNIELRARQLRRETVARLLRRVAAWLGQKIRQARRSALEN